MGRTLRASAVTFSAREMTMNWPKCMGILLTKEPWLGFGFHRCLHIQGCIATCGTITETPSNCIRLSHRRAEHITLTLGQTNPFKEHLTRRDFPYSFLLNTLRWQQFMTARLGAVAFTVLWCEVIYQNVKIPCTVGQGRVCNTTARASSWP